MTSIEENKTDEEITERDIIEKNVHNSLIRISILGKEDPKINSEETENILRGSLEKLYKTNETPRVPDLWNKLLEIEDTEKYGLDHLINKINRFITDPYLRKISKIDEVDLVQGLDEVIIFTQNEDLVLSTRL